STARYSSQMAEMISSLREKWYVMLPGLNDRALASISIRKSTTPVRLMISFALVMISSRVEFPVRLAEDRGATVGDGPDCAEASFFRGLPGLRFGWDEGRSCEGVVGFVFFTCVFMVSEIVWLYPVLPSEVAVRGDERRPFRWFCRSAR
ncbi:MAG: hypothetical protein K2K83_04500, partial [Rikenella sp.]|nr:hypothetical protein [Rikenella sp.]